MQPKFCSAFIAVLIKDRRCLNFHNPIGVDEARNLDCRGCGFIVTEECDDFCGPASYIIIDVESIDIDTDYI